MKTCMKCKVSKDESDFGNHHGFKCGLNSRCKSCEKTQRDAFRTPDMWQKQKTHGMVGGMEYEGRDYRFERRGMYP